MYRHTLSYKPIVTAAQLSCSNSANSSFEFEQSTTLRKSLTEKRGCGKTDNVEPVYNNYSQAVSKTKETKGNLIPTEYRKVFWTLIGNQEKWNKVIDKVVSKLDELEDQPLVINEVQLK